MLRNRHEINERTYIDMRIWSGRWTVYQRDLFNTYKGERMQICNLNRYKMKRDLYYLWSRDILISYYCWPQISINKCRLVSVHFFFLFSFLQRCAASNDTARDCSVHCRPLFMYLRLLHNLHLRKCLIIPLIINVEQKQNKFWMHLKERLQRCSCWMNVQKKCFH